MTQAEKEQLHNQAKALLSATQKKISEEMAAIPGRLTQIMELRDLESASGEITNQTLVRNQRKRFDQLKSLYPSPYFNRLELAFKNEKNPREIFIGKFPFAEENIYSWTAPIASIRFESPGPFSFTVDEKTQSGKIESKDQYLIVDGEIKFLASEKYGAERELIYQEYFSQHKTDFVLPEILAQMEKSQDEVIRAKAKGPLVISGPAGSGKTTLALHRVAYLLQSPDTSDSYSQDKIIVFVQDASTKDYFSGLLPSFGIRDVRIVTFGEWALDCLGLSKLNSVNRFLGSIDKSNCYESAKLAALRSGSLPEISPRGCFAGLAEYYAEFFTDEQKKFFNRQKKEGALDRIDLTALLLSRLKQGPLEISRKYYRMASDKSLERRMRREAADYSLIIVDEFENYLPEQISLIRSALNRKESSILYVGDLKQQIYLGAIKAWQDLGEEFEEYDRLDPAAQKNIIRLQKVYRNTKGILEYIASSGYKIEVPEQLRPGQPVEEVRFIDQEQEIAWIKEKIVSAPDVSIGILAQERDYLAPYEEEFKDLNNVRIMPIHEAQGVEFDAVFLLGIDEHLLKNDLPEESLDEQGREFRRISRDLLYIAMTRAMNELYVSIK